MTIQYRCTECSKTYDITPEIFRCTCGGLLDLDAQNPLYSPASVNHSEWSLFRYLHTLPVDKTRNVWKSVTMGEGLTPLVQLDHEDPALLAKVDYLMPTLSFKDRGAALLITVAKEINARKIIQDSSGNAGNSIAAYAARVGIPCEIFVPEGTSSKKIKMIQSHGAKVTLIKGSREDTAKAALDAAINEDVFYASHVYNPFFYQGTKTYAYEIYEQLGDKTPDNLIIPVGNGTLLLGAYYGFMDLKKAGLIQSLPRIIAVQAEGCSPIHKAFSSHSTTVEPTENTGTSAEGIAIANPMRGRQILDALYDTGGMVITAPENMIPAAQAHLSKKGFYVEPTTAATFAGYQHHRKKLDGLSILPLCGAGLKKE